MAIGKTIMSPKKKFALSFHVSNIWYEIINGNKCYYYFSLYHKRVDYKYTSFLNIGFVFLFLNVTFIIKTRKKV